MRRKRVYWGRIVRRGTALFMATVAVWALVLTTGAGAAMETVRTLGENAAFVTAALETELGAGPQAGPWAALSALQRLALGQSALLKGNRETIEAHLAQGGAPVETSPAPEEDPEDPSNLAPPPHTIVERTLVPTSPDGYLTAGDVYVFNRTQLPVDVGALVAAPVEITLEPGPQVLIMHTHTSEAYTQAGAERYQETDNSRTLDTQYNVVRVGDEMARIFTEMGLSVLHDTTFYDYPAYKGAYSRSMAGVEDYLRQYPTIKIVLDVHRDALIGEDGTVYKAVTTIDGAKTAQVMLVLGSSEGGVHPDWAKNLTLATKLQRSMNVLYPTLARPITLRASRYNQQLTTGSLLVEVGCHGNTLEEALAGARLFARAAGQVLVGLR